MKLNYHWRKENKMFTIESKNVHIIPVDFWSFFQEAVKYKEKNMYSSKHNIDESTFDLLNDYINNYIDDCFLAIDMNNISSYPMHLFTKFNCTNPNVFFFNVNENGVQLRMKEDINELHWIDDTTAIFALDKRSEIEKIIATECRNARKQKEAEILCTKMLKKEKAVYKLESSGLYSNCYLSVKHLFKEVEDLYYIIFGMSQEIAKLPKFDAFVTSSKNGAILASILGDLLNIKEIHLLGVGPKYTVQFGDSLDCIKTGKRYLYIFDFMCTGTELKIVSALINSKRAKLRGAVGISRYKEENEMSLDYGISVLVESKDFDITYRVAGRPEELN